jgi:hypothetical protein
MEIPTYIDLRQARELLERMGVKFTIRQIKRAAEKNAVGQRKLPFFVDPIDKRLKIEKGTLVRIYQQLQQEAENNLRE